MTGVTPEDIGFFVSTKTPEPKLWCKECGRFTVCDPSIPGQVVELERLHVHGQRDGRWSS
ncbi:MAG TPA: hypothetical protein VK611_11460 [Acidimicrobiales bacterium]|nr:hypothetical protein [Acidimicrobiales bacterium]